MIELAFVGAGRVGNALARRFHALGYPIREVWSRSNAEDLATSVDAEISLPKQAQIAFLTVPDDAIRETVTQITESGYRGALVHVSGVHDLEVFADLEQPSGSFHPMYPFRKGIRLSGEENMLVGIEANEDFLQAQLIELAEALGGRPAILRTGQKSLYHASAVIASNYLVALFAESLALMKASGVNATLGREALLELMRGTLANLSATDPASALTGPIARGDLATIQKHLDALPPDAKRLYCAMGRETAKLAPQLDDATRQNFFDLFNT